MSTRRVTSIGFFALAIGGAALAADVPPSAAIMNGVKCAVGSTLDATPGDAFRIIGWPVPDGRLLLKDLIEHATQRKFVYRHAWRVGDLVIWDNRCTMHRATPFEDLKYRRELRRVTTLDIEPALARPA